MMKNVCILVMIIAALFSVSAVSAQDTVEVETITFEDDLGRSVTIPTEVASVVTLAPSLTETVVFLGGEDLIKAVDTNSDFPESMNEMDKVTSWDTGVNYEMLLALDPDIIFASEMTSLEEISNMEKLGLTVYCVKNPVDFLDLYESILIIGGIIGKTDEAGELIGELISRVDAVEEVMEGCTEKSLVFYELDATDPDKPWTAGKGTFISEMIRLSCGENLGDVLEGAWAQISLEALIQEDPDVILLGDAAYGNSPESVSARTGWGEISAVKNGRLFEFDDDLVSRPGPRLVDGLEVIAHLLHPERFEQ